MLRPFSIFAIAFAVDKKWVISIIFIAIALLFYSLVALLRPVLFMVKIFKRSSLSI